MSTAKLPAFLISSNGVVTLYSKGRAYSASPTHTNYQAIRKAIKTKHWLGIEKLFDVADAIKKACHKRVEVKNGEILYGGTPVHNVVCDKIFQFIKEGLDTKPLLAFLKRLLTNPSTNSVEQLYKFVDANNLTISWDGYIICYKRVTSDYKDARTETFDNSIGAKPKMPRAEVEDNPASACSRGLHVGGFSFVQRFSAGSASHVMVCKVDPTNVVSVPNDANCGKCRVCEYEVIAELPADMPEIQQSSASEIGWSSDDDDDEIEDFEECPGCGYDVDNCGCGCSSY